MTKRADQSEVKKEQRGGSGFYLREEPWRGLRSVCVCVCLLLGLHVFYHCDLKTNSMFLSVILTLLH